MRIVHVAPFYSPVIGGVEEVVKKVAEYMVSKGNEVYVVTYNRLRASGEGFLSEEAINDVHVVRLKPKIMWSHGTYSTDLPEAMRRLRPDLVHVHVWRHPHVYQVAKLKKRLGFEAVLHTHAPFHTFSQLGVAIWMYHKAADWLMKKALRRYDTFVALTSHERRILVEKLGIQEERVIIVPNGIDDGLVNSDGNPVDKDPVVLYLGRISRSKNVDLLVKAMMYVKKEVSNAKLILVGPDEGLVTKLREHEVGFQHLGAVSEGEKCRVYGECTVFAHPAYYEPFGMTLLEAQAFGKPCVITGEGGQRCVAPSGKTSLYAKPNPEDFGAAITLLLSDRELYGKLSANARGWASQYVWSRVLPVYDAIYDALV